VQARIALAAAERAAAVLDAELTEAKASHDAAAKAHDTAIAAILDLAAASHEFWSALRTAEEAFIRRGAYDRFARPKGWIACTVVNSTLREAAPDFRRYVGSRVVDTAPWQRTYDALRPDLDAAHDVRPTAIPRRVVENTVGPVSTDTMPELDRLRLVYASERDLPPLGSRRQLPADRSAQAAHRGHGTAGQAGAHRSPLVQSAENVLTVRRDTGLTDGPC
jgi:hypothetical protein